MGDISQMPKPPMYHKSEIDLSKFYQICRKGAHESVGEIVSSLARRPASVSCLALSQTDPSGRPRSLDPISHFGIRFGVD